jgi:transposase
MPELAYPQYPIRSKNEGELHYRSIQADMKILKQVAGIDVSKDELVVSVGRLKEDLTSEIYGNKVVSNTAKGFKELSNWIKKKTVVEVPVTYVMEATGVYHEALAYYLADENEQVSIVMPSKMSNYQKTLEIKTVTDKTSSEVITSFGLEKNVGKWKKPVKIYRDMRQLTRERDQLTEQKTVLKNQLHAEQSEAYPNERSIARIKERISVYNRQEKEIMQEISAYINQDEQVRNLTVLLGSIPGIGLLTAVIIISETNGFDLIRNRKQLSSYAGLDVKEKQSGTSVKGKPRISKKGNRYLRKAMYFPALAAIRHDQRFKAIYARLVGKHGIKMKAAVCVQRKLLELAFTIYKTNKPYDKQYLEQKNTENSKNKEAA